MKPYKPDFEEYPRTLAPDDFWGQIKRTVNGKPVSEEHIMMIVEAIRSGLNFESSDKLLDIACGNGALSRYFFPFCSEFLGVDLSEYLIEVAKRNFENLPCFEFKRGEALEYVKSEPAPDRFTKALCYGSFTYLSAENAVEFLEVLSARFSGLQRLFIGNLPDKERAHLFYRDPDYLDQLENPNSPIGIWRSQTEFEKLASETGWKVVRFNQMPKEFYAAHYRYDVILEPSR